MCSIYAQPTGLMKQPLLVPFYQLTDEPCWLFLLTLSSYVDWFHRSVYCLDGNAELRNRAKRNSLTERLGLTHCPICKISVKTPNQWEFWGLQKLTIML